MPTCNKCGYEIVWKQKKNGDGSYMTNTNGSYHSINQNDRWGCSLDGKNHLTEAMRKPEPPKTKEVSVSLDRILLSLLDEQKKTNELLDAILNKGSVE